MNVRLNILNKTYVFFNRCETPKSINKSLNFWVLGLTRNHYKHANIFFKIIYPLFIKKHPKKSNTHTKMEEKQNLKKRTNVT